jgi:RNA polymerase sigma-70 factor (ECF subfamily)
VNADRARFEAMFTTHYPAVMKYAIRRVGAEAADEIAAETFLVAWRRLDRVPDEALPWLYGTARRVIANEYRRRERTSRLSERIEGERRVPPVDPSESVPQAIRIREALAGLSETDQEVLRLTEWEQLDAAEAAAVLGCTKPAFAVRLHRARRRLAHVLQDNQPTPALLPRGGTR